MPVATRLKQKARMYGYPINSKRGTPSRQNGLWRSLFALLCILGMFASFPQPASARAPSKAASVAFVQGHSVKGGKPCQRAVPGALGASCSAGTFAGLEIRASSVMEPAGVKSGAVPFTDKLLHGQWLSAPQYRPPRIGA